MRRSLAATRSWSRLGIWAATFLVLLLPVLVAFLRIDTAATVEERQRLARALDQGSSSKSPVLSSFYASALPADAERQFLLDPERTTQRARLAGMLGTLAISLLLYLLVMLSRGRGLALLACAGLALQPAVASTGYILRPETPSTMFALLAAVLWTGAGRGGGDPRGWRRHVYLAGVVGCAAVVVGLAAACVRSASLWAFLPAVVASLLTLRQMPVFLRFVRRHRIERWPSRAAVARLLPFVLGWFWAMAALWGLQRSGIRADMASPISSAALPMAFYLRWPIVVVMAVGGLRLLWVAGFRQRLRNRAVAVLLGYLILALVLGLRIDAGFETLGMAPALAVLVAEGLYPLLTWAVGRLQALGRITWR